MRPSVLRRFTSTAVAVVIIGSVAGSRSASARRAPADDVTSYGRLAATFVRNVGQAARPARFVSTGGAHQIFFTDSSIRLVDRRHASSLWLTFIASRATSVEGARPTGGIVNYVRQRRVSSEPAFAEVIYRNLWPGIDGRVTSTTSGLEYAFEVRPYWDPGAIRLRYDGASRIALDDSGNIIISTAAGPLIDRAPVAYQIVAGRRVPVRSRFLVDGHVVTFELGSYDRHYPLVIDPTLSYSTYLGGSGFDAGNAIAVDATGAAYVAGVTKYLDFPTTPGSYDPSWNGGSGNAPSDVFVGKINPAGDHFAYMTFLGGSGNEEAFGIAVDAAGQAYVTGFTESDNFPTTAGAYRPAVGISHHDGFLTKLNAAGSAIVYSTYFGTNASTDPIAVAVDASGQAYVTGNTWSSNLPSTPGKIGPSWTSTGKRDTFVLKFNAAGSSVLYGTYVGGDRDDLAGGIAVSGSGRAFITGMTESLNLRTSPSSVQPRPAGSTFRTTDGGQTWQRGNGGMRSPHARALAIDPNAPSNVYEGTALHGILKSTDGGLTWAPANAGFPYTVVVNDIVVDPGTAGVVFAATGFGIYRSLDAGGSWLQVGPPASRVAFAPSNPSVAYAVNSLGAHKTTNGGGTWTKVLDGDARSLAIDPTNALTVIVGTGSSQVLKTTDGGASWTTATAGSPPTLPAVLALLIDPVSPNVMYAGLANSSTVKSTDGGATWSYAPGPQFSQTGRMTFDAADGNAFYAAGSSGISVSKDRGATWNTLPIAGNYLNVEGLAAHAGTVVAGIIAQPDAFVYQIDTTSTSDGLVYGMYLGGAGIDSGRGIALDQSGNAVVVASGSPDFPGMPPSSTLRMHVLSRLNASGTAFTVSSRIGPGGSYVAAAGVAVDSAGVAYVTGVYDDDDPRVWIDRIEPNGLVSSEYFIDGLHSGLGSSPAWDQGTAIAVDGAGDVYITGNTTASDYPTTPNAPQPHYGSGARDAIISKVSFADVAGSNRDLARGRPVVASSTEAPQHAAANAVDGNDSTRWSSQFSDPQWIYVDLGERIALDHIVIKWEAAFASEYSLQVSDDATSWVEIRHRTGTGGVEVLTGLQGAGRYVRVLGLRRATPWGYSIFALEIYGTPTSAPPSSNLAPNRPATSSSAESQSFQASFAFDGRMDTRFSSAFSDNEWLQVDLGQIVDISRVVLKWEAAFGADYQIQARDTSNATWRVIANVTGGDGGVDDLIGLSGTGRYVRMLGLRRGTPWGYSLWEFEIYGTPATPNPARPDVVIYASDSFPTRGTWSRRADSASPNATKMVTPDKGVSNVDAPLANPAEYLDIPFSAEANVPYTIWLRLKAANNSKFNDSVWVQFSDAMANGSARYPLGSTSALLVNLATDSTAASLQNWGWQNSAYWLTQPTTLTFAATGSHTIRIQIREDGVEWDQIVLSPARYLSAGPGPVSNDATIVSRQ